MVHWHTSTLQDIRPLSEDAQMLRQKVVELVKSGKKQVEAAEILRLHRTPSDDGFRNFSEAVQDPQPRSLSTNMISAVSNRE